MHNQIFIIVCLRYILLTLTHVLFSSWVSAVRFMSISMDSVFTSSLRIALADVTDSLEWLLKLVAAKVRPNYKMHVAICTS